eukprot:TRINITY_DN578_c2_g1_i1.p1 TRINITY_DN578_c2_g1~~TRINITY_DN578_c2_g1_i1.p1  ORF type:complete len:258 (+),score=45.01 TRINITY_DN578_c2_g1_i1:90-776(+)
MKAKTYKYIIVVLLFISWILTIVGSAVPNGFLEEDGAVPVVTTNGYNNIYRTYYNVVTYDTDCGVFECFVIDLCDDFESMAKAARAFVVIALLIMSLLLLIHLAMCHQKTCDKMLANKTFYKISKNGGLAFLHLFTCACLVVAWGILLGIFTTEKCGITPKDFTKLFIAVPFYIIATVFCFIVCILCYMKKHMAIDVLIVENQPPHYYPPVYSTQPGYAVNPIDGYYR